MVQLGTEGVGEGLVQGRPMATPLFFATAVYRWAARASSEGPYSRGCLALRLFWGGGKCAANLGNMVKSHVVTNQPSRISFFSSVLGAGSLFSPAQSFEGICNLLPVENALENKAEIFQLLYISMALVAVVYVGVGLLCYLAWPLVDKGSITAYLVDTHEGSFTAGLMSWLVMISLVFTFPVIMVSAMIPP